jgi:hypothetical protein
LKLSTGLTTSPDELDDLLSLELLPPPHAAIKAAPTPAEADAAMNPRLLSPRVQ